MKRLALAVLAVLVAAAAHAAPPSTPSTPAPAAKTAAKPAAKAAPLTGEDKSFYAVGLLMAASLDVFKLSDAELQLVVQGMKEGTAGKGAFEVDGDVRAEVQALARKRQAAAAEAAKSSGDAFRAKAAAAPGAEKTASGLIYVSLAEGTGAQPKASDEVTVRYTGKLVDGKVFDASEQHGGTASFPLSGVVPCWTEGVQKMKVGGKARLVCPPELAYGDQGAPGAIPPGATLDFEVELVSTQAPAPEPAMPEGEKKN